MLQVLQYRWKEGRDGEATLVLITHEAWEQVFSDNEAQLLNRAIAGAQERFFVVARAPHIDASFYHNCFKILSGSRKTRLIRRRQDSPVLCAAKEVLERGIAFRPAESIGAAMDSFVEEALSRRSFNILDIETLIPSVASSADSVEVVPQIAVPEREPATFTVIEKEFKLVAESAIPRQVADTNVPVHEIPKIIEESIKLINDGRFNEALGFIRPYSKSLADFTEIHFLHSIAEINAGLPIEAMKSLLLVIEKNPDHGPARQILEDLKKALNMS